MANSYQDDGISHSETTQNEECLNFLKTSNLSQKWIDFIMGDSDLCSYLLQAVHGVTELYGAHPFSSKYPSQDNMILAALRYCDPCDVKVVILGHDPVPDSVLATGLAFSLPPGTSENDVLDTEPGSDAKTVHKALRCAEIDPGQSLCHEHWARSGVLLLNACLTLNPSYKTEYNSLKGKWENPHFKYWENFICSFFKKLLTTLQETRQLRQDPRPIFVLCWGTQAQDVGRYLKENMDVRYDGDHSELLQPSTVIATGHHPTNPRGRGNKFLTQAVHQFTAIKKHYLKLFDQNVEVEAALVSGLSDLSMQNND